MSEAPKPRDAEAERQRRLADAFGDALPEQTTDEDSEGWGERATPQADSRDDEWLRRQVPPHHG